jgi:AcrR family transcriptional regulator
VPRTKAIHLQPAARERRSHAERTAETRARIIAAVVESIAEVGFQRTTAAEVTRRAGVTWGAVQHHFGGKDGLLVAVLEDSFNRFASRLAGIPTEDATLEKRASLFIDRAWEHFASPHFRSTFEILLSYAGRQDLEEPPSWQSQMLQAWDSVWQHLFADARIARRRRFILQQYVISSLAGMASILALEGGGARVPDEALGMLKETLLRELERGEP